MTPYEVKPCPFCGSTALHISEDDKGQARWVFCENCECDGPPVPHDLECSREEALDFILNAWNKRSGE